MHEEEEKVAIQQECGRCKGKRLIYKPYKDIWGGRHNEQECPVCHGSGRNPDYKEKRCEYSGGCWSSVAYSAKSEHPPKYCEYHKGVVARERQEASSRRDSRDHQPQRSSSSGAWQEKRCSGFGGSYCGNTIKYRTDWDKIPDLCQTCREKAKSQKTERDAKMLEKPCARQGCSNSVRYSVDWDHPPSFCKSCSDKRKAMQAQYPNINRKFVTHDTSYVMPGMGQTIAQMGGVWAQHYPHQGTIHCMVFEGMRDDDLHYSWNLDPITGDLVGEVYVHHNNPRGT